MPCPLFGDVFFFHGKDVVKLGAPSYHQKMIQNLAVEHIYSTNLVCVNVNCSLIKIKVKILITCDLI